MAWNQSANQYLVVWGDARNTLTRGSDIYGRRVSARGTPVGTGFRISGPNATSSESNAEVVWNSNANQYLVVWSDPRGPSTRGYDIYGQRVGG